MDNHGWNTTYFAAVTSPSQGTTTGSFPSPSIATMPAAAMPTRMGFAPNVLRAPRSLAPRRTKGKVAVKIRCGTRKPLAAPFTRLRLAIGSPWVRATPLATLSTIPRTISLVAAACARTRLAASQALCGLLRLAPAVNEVTLPRTVALGRSPILRVIRLATSHACSGVGYFSHNESLSYFGQYCNRTIEERYCEIAARRLEQGVLFT